MYRKYEPNYKGYFYINRAVLKAFITKYELTFAQLGSLIFFISQIDFDRKHKYYSKFLRDDDVLAKSLGMSSSTIYKQRKMLIDKKIFIADGKSTIFPCFFLFKLEYASLFAKMNYEQIKYIFDNPQKGEEKIKRLSDKSQTNRPEITNPFNTSSKENIGLSDEDRELSDDDCDIDFQEGGGDNDAY